MWLVRLLLAGYMHKTGIALILHAELKGTLPDDEYVGQNERNDVDVALVTKVYRLNLYGKRYD